VGVTRYRSPDEDSGRWRGFPFRDGDIVITTRSKSGTTWMQMICALLIFQTPDVPRPLGELSPWLDWLVAPRDEVYAQLAAQEHRRFIKTHTPLDGVPIDRRATYLFVGRHPLDMAVSLYHQGDNLDRERMRRLTGARGPAGPAPPRPDLHTWLKGWIAWEGSPRDDLDSLPGVVWHASDAWSRRTDPNIVLVHYADLSADLEGEMRGLADRLGIVVPDDRWPTLVRAATFDRMRSRADVLAPDPVGVLKDRAAFFRRGTSGAAREVLSVDELEGYRRRVELLGPTDALAWLHHGRRMATPS
jgi:aryl sulfotransferase